MNKNLKILLVDDHPMLLKGLEEELYANNYTNIITATNGNEALDLIIEHTPDIAILDIEMPLLSGFEVIKKSQEVKVPTKFIILTSHKESRYIYKAKILNISGYLLKDEPFKEIKKCLTSVCNGKNYFSSAFNTIFDTEISPEIKKIKLLTPSELLIVKLIANEKSSKEIADSLLISIRTVQKHRSNIIVKLGLESQNDVLVLWAKNHRDLIV